MYNKCALFLVAVTLLVSNSCSSSIDMSKDKLLKSYAKINQYLEKNVQSDEPVMNMEKLEDLLNEQSSRCTFLTGKSLIDTLYLLIDFAAVPKNDFGCNRASRLKLSEKIDSGLSDHSRQSTQNYPLTRLDKIIQHYAFKDASRCDPGRSLPLMEYGFKRIAYDNISNRLKKELPETDDVDANMTKAEEMLQNMPDGAVADALRQLLQLKSTLSEDTCNKKGFEIIFRNDLATRGYAHTYFGTSSRRVDTIVKHFALQHEHLCRPVVFRFFQTELKKLDHDTYRYVLGLASSQFLDEDDYVKLMEELSSKKVDADFSTPLLVDYAKSRLSKCPRNKLYCKLDRIQTIDLEKLPSYIDVVSSGDPGSGYINTIIVDQWGSEEVVDDEKLKGLLNKYLFEPCGRFIKRFGGSVEADEYSNHMNDNHASSYIEKFIEELSYHTVRAGYYACKHVYQEQEAIFNAIKSDTSEKVPTIY